MGAPEFPPEDHDIPDPDAEGLIPIVDVPPEEEDDDDDR